MVTSIPSLIHLEIQIDQRLDSQFNETRWEIPVERLQDIWVHNSEGLTELPQTTTKPYPNPMPFDEDIRLPRGEER